MEIEKLENLSFAELWALMQFAKKELEEWEAALKNAKKDADQERIEWSSRRCDYYHLSIDILFEVLVNRFKDVFGEIFDKE